MTRSDNPFGDLPEWKERQRLQESHGQQPGADPQALEPGYAPEPPTLYPNAEAGYAQTGYDDGSGMPHTTQPPYQSSQDPRYSGGAPTHHGGHEQYAAPHQDVYAASPQAAPLHYEVTQPSAYDTGGYDQLPSGGLGYDPHNQNPYPIDANGQPATAYQHSDQLPPSYDPAQASDGFGMRDGHHDHGNEMHPDAHYPTGQAAAVPSYDLNHFSPGQQTAPGQVNPVDGTLSHRNPNGQTDPEWQAGQIGSGVAVTDDDEDDYYDDDENDEPQRYSWKLLAAVVVTGAVVTGGGVVLYDSFKGGGLGSRGDAPIIKADRGPAKTAPTNAGGRTFAHRDSKLLGRLDNSGGSKTTRKLSDDTEAGNRVRSVPTVRIGRDGRLILPKEPEAVNPPAHVAGIGNAGSQASVPGINVVESLNGSSGSGPGGLPSVVAKPAQSVTNTTARVRNIVPEVKPPKTVKAAARNVVIKNLNAANRSTTASSRLPPVPTRSAVGSAWRMTSTRTSASTTQNVAGIRPTIARQIATSTTGTASTLGAGTVVKKSGYVAVLATAPSRVRALQSYAEIQQKHPNALANRVPDVQRADLRSRGLGIMYRLVIGPAGTRSTANSVCNSLKSEGYKGCWVKSY